MLNSKKVVDAKLNNNTKITQVEMSFSGDAEAKSLFQSNWKGRGFGGTLTGRVTRRTGIFR